MESNDLYNYLSESLKKVNFLDNKMYYSKDSLDNDKIIKNPKYKNEIQLDLNKYNYDYINDYTKENNKHKITTVTNKKISNKYSDLKDIEDLHIKFTDSLDGDVKTDLEYVENQVQKIRDKIKNSRFLQGINKQKYRNDSQIPGFINEYIDAYYDIIGELMDLIEQETESIISFGQAYVDMDQDLQKRQDELREGIYVGNLVEETPVKRNRNVEIIKESVSEIQIPVQCNIYLEYTGRSVGGASPGIFSIVYSAS